MPREGEPRCGRPFWFFYHGETVRARGRVEADAILELSEALDVANRRLERLEAKAEFDRRLERGR